MGLELCKDCGWMHYTTDACREPKKSTAARTGRAGPYTAATMVRDADAPRQGGERDAPPAGTQAPPVDIIIGKRRGRPQTITDMKAYKREKERERRAKHKEKP